jgi:outer membrane protein
MIKFMRVIAISLILILQNNAFCLTLEECFESAKKTNPRFEILGINEKQKKLSKAIALLEILPEVELTRKLNQDEESDRDAELTKLFKDKGFKAAPKTDAEKNEISVSGDLSLAKISSIGAQSAAADAQKSDALDKEQTLIMEGVKLYTQLCEARQIVEVLSSTLEVTKNRARAAKAKFEMGYATKIDVLNVEAELMKATFDKESYEDKLNSIQHQFIQFFGIKPEGEIKKPRDPKYLPSSLEELLKATLANNPKLKYHQNNTAVKKALLAQSFAERMPKISYAIKTNLGDLEKNAKTAWNLSVPILAGRGRSVLEIPLKKHELRKATIDKMYQQDDLETNVIDCWKEQDQTRAELKMCNKFVEARNLRLTAANQEYALGKSKLEDLYLAAKELEEARLRQIQAEINAKYKMLSLCGGLSAALLQNDQLNKEKTKSQKNTKVNGKVKPSKFDI